MIEIVSDDPLIGMKLGIETKAERFHPMAIAAISTANFKAAVDHLARYKKLTTPEEILSELADSQYRVSFRWLLAVDAELQVLADYRFHGWSRCCGTGPAHRRSRSVHRHKHLRSLSRYLGCQVLEGAPQNAIIFQTSGALAPFVTWNTEPLDLLAPQFEEQLRQLKEEDSFVELVRKTIQDKLTGQRSSVEVISQALHVSPRTLRWRRQESGQATSACWTKPAISWPATTSGTPPWS